MSETPKDSPPAFILRDKDGKVILTGQTVRLSIRGSLPPDHPCHALIGRVASAWTQFEYMLDLVVWDMGNLNRETGVCITGQMMGATGRFKAIEALGRKVGLGTETLEKFRKLRNQHYEIAEQRNRIVHDPWFVVLESDDGTMTGGVSQMKVAGDTPVNTTQVEETIQRIETLTGRVSKLRGELSVELHALRNRQKPQPPASPPPEAR